MERPIFSVQRALLVWICGAVLVVLCMAFSEVLPRWCTVFWVLLFGGQVPLAAIVTKGKINSISHIGFGWIDVLTVFLVPWAGPVFWYHEWKRVQKDPSVLEANVIGWKVSKRYVFRICLFAFLLTAVLILIRGYLSK